MAKNLAATELYRTSRAHRCLMRIANYDQTLSKFGLEKLKTRVDLCLDSHGNMATNRDGGLASGPPPVNALFRLVERWRVSEYTIGELFNAWQQTKLELSNLESVHNRSSLTIGPRRYMTEVESIGELQENCGILAGAIFVSLSNLLQRFAKDLEIKQNSSTNCIHSQNEFYAVVISAANNFRHYDEWAALSESKGKPKRSIDPLCDFLGIPKGPPDARPSITTNVCSPVLEKLSNGSADTLHTALFEFAKNAANYKGL